MRLVTFSRLALASAMAVITWLALSANPPSPGGMFDFDKVNHVLAFFVLAGLTDYAFPDVTSLARKLSPIAMFGLAIEGLQFVSGYRYFEWLDLAADGLGLALFVGLRRWLHGVLDRVLLVFFKP